MDPCRARAMSTGINVKVRRKKGQITAVLIEPRLDFEQQNPHPFQDSNITTFTERLFDAETPGPVAGARTLIQHKGLFSSESWLLHWADIRLEEMTEIYQGAY